MKRIRVLLRKAISLALHSFQVDQRRAVLLFGIADQAADTLHVVAVRRADIVKAHVLENGTGQQQVFKALLEIMHPAHGSASAGQFVEHVFHPLFHAGVRRTQAQPRQILRDGADTFGNGHIVVV